MDTESTVEFFALARAEAADYVGETGSTEELAALMLELARKDPQQARQIIETVAARLDEATEGKRTEQLDQLENVTLQALGLDAQNMVAALDDGPLDGGRRSAPPEAQN